MRSMPWGKRAGETSKERLARLVKWNIERKWWTLMRRSSVSEGHQWSSIIPFEKLWGFFLHLCILWMVMIAFLLCASCHVRCWGTKMNKTQSCLWETYLLVQGHILRGINCIWRSEWCQGRPQRGSSWSTRESRSHDREMDLLCRKYNWWVQEFLKCEAVLYIITS